MIELQNITKGYGNTTVLSDVSISIQPNEFLIISGGSGSGKSTLLNLLIGNEIAESGSILVDGVDLTKIPRRALQLYRRRVGFIWQDFKLLPEYSVRENIAFPLEVFGTKQQIIDEEVNKVIDLLNLTEKQQLLVSSLSGSEKARTAIARAVVHNPMIILADEPTASLDTGEAIEVIKILKKLHENGTTIILATNDSMIIDALNTRVINLENYVFADIPDAKHEEPEIAKETSEEAVSIEEEL